MSLIINPGTGPVDDASAVGAAYNMGWLSGDLEETGAVIGAVTFSGDDDGTGRFACTLEVNGRVHEIDMPGIPIGQVRFVDDPGQNIWDFPRLYVDGSSWVWNYALNILLADDELEED